jgi:hypothetical protein
MIDLLIDIIFRMFFRIVIGIVIIPIECIVFLPFFLIKNIFVKNNNSYFVNVKLSFSNHIIKSFFYSLFINPNKHK